MKAKTIKARVMHEDKNGFLWDNRNPGDTPHFVLPATREAYEGMVEQMAKGLHESSPSIGVCPYDVAPIPLKKSWRRIASRALASINIKEPKA
jgi:hypothetical protein